MESLLQVLNSLSISAFLSKSQHDKLITIDQHSHVRDTLQVMYQNRISSVPLTKDNVVVNSVDMFDFLTYLLELWEVEKVELDTSPDHARILPELFTLGQRFLRREVYELPDSTGNDVFAAVMQEENSTRIIKLYGLGVHRVALVDFQGNVNRIVCQSDVIRFLADNLQLLGEYAQKTIGDLSVFSDDELVTIKEQEPVISGFKLLADNIISAVPIINSLGVVSGTLSTSDLKYLKDDTFTSLLLSARQYKDEQATNIPNTTCTLNDTLSSVITNLASTNLHRIWVVNEKQQPIHVVSLTNICNFISKFIPSSD
eukprot:TRINITY_DN966_c0_g1_i1.p1 TRINITY_DN966_c0_g1~~TRINITY_DN966_c0_g1_i1.p1  ORF type:complete len:314 (-),score=42.28 TRINITY_DN966_c0_g1_i1:20-961(-)